MGLGTLCSCCLSLLGLQVGPNPITDFTGHDALVATECPDIGGTLLLVVVNAALGNLQCLILGQIHLELLGQAIGMVALMGAEHVQLEGRTQQILAHLGLIRELHLLQLIDLLLLEWIFRKALTTYLLNLGCGLGHPFVVSVGLD